MNQIVKAFSDLSESVSHNCKDSSLAHKLETSIQSLLLEHLDLSMYARIMLSIYDLSNSCCLIDTSQQSVSFHPLSIRLRIQTMKMIVVLLKIVNKQNVNRFPVYSEVVVQAFEIMVMSIRICIQSGYQVNDDLLQFNSYCRNLYQSSTRCQQQCDIELKLMYYVNCLDLLRITIDSSKFVISDFMNILCSWFVLYESLANGDQIKKEYVSYICAEVCIKLLRNGRLCRQQQIEGLFKYLPADYRNAIQNVMNGKVNCENHEILGDGYELYWEIITRGVQQISQDYLYKLVDKMHMDSDNKIFEIVILTHELSLLEMWFEISNKKMSKPNNLNTAYQCFISIVQKFLYEPNTVVSTHQSAEQTYTKSTAIKDECLIRLSRQIILNMLRQTKQTSLPVETVMKYLCKLLVHLVCNCNHSLIQDILELFSNLYIALSKFGYSSYSKMMTALQLYFEMLNGCSKPDTYKKFMKHNSSDKSEYIRLIKASYEIQHKLNQNVQQEVINLLNNRIEFALLLADPGHKQLLILSLDTSSFLKIDNFLDIYGYLLEKHKEDENSLLRVAEHIETVFLTTDYRHLPLDKHGLSRLKIIITQFIDQLHIFCVLWLYLCCFELKWQEIRNRELGPKLNRFSRLAKIVDLTDINDQIGHGLQILICKTCEKFKKNYAIEGKVNAQPGQVSFLTHLYQRLLNFIGNQGQTIEFVKFSMFQIYCVNKRDNELEDFLNNEHDPKIWKLCLSSNVIPKNYKRSILRKLFKLQFNCTTNINITLQDLHQLINLSDSQEEVSIYISSAIDIFGERGKKLVEIIASYRPQVANILLRNNQ